MNRLLTFTAIIEAATGLALMAVPPSSSGYCSVAKFRRKHPPRPHGRLWLALAGDVLLPGRDPRHMDPALRAMLTYNSLATLYLFGLGIGGEWVGPLLWPAVALHGILSLLMACR